MVCSFLPYFEHIKILIFCLLIPFLVFHRWIYFAGKWVLLYRARYSIKLTLELPSRILHGFRFSPDIKVQLQATHKKKTHTHTHLLKNYINHSPIIQHVLPPFSMLNTPLFGTLACPSKRRAAESTGAALRCCLGVMPSKPTFPSWETPDPSGVHEICWKRRMAAPPAFRPGLGGNEVRRLHLFNARMGPIEPCTSLTGAGPVDRHDGGSAKAISMSIMM